MAELDLLTVLGLGLTLREYEAKMLDGATPYYEMVDLAFECTHCGQCCNRPGVVYITEDDLERIGAHFEISPAKVRATWLTADTDGSWMIEVDKGQQCPFLHNDRCTIHEAKPQQCQTYPFWHEIVGTAEAWEDEREHCPGIDKGRWFTAEDVRRLLLGVDKTP